MRRGWVLILFLAGLSCARFRAYFNTYYNAKRIFRDAETRYLREGFTPDLRDQYNKVIEKCVVIIRYFSGTPYVDDALYMLGVSYLRLKDYDRARRRFQELLGVFPDSPLRTRALLGLAEVALLDENPGMARTILDTLNLSGKDRMHARRLRLLVARAEGDTAGFLNALVDMAREFPEAVSVDLFLEGIDLAISGGYYDQAEVLLQEFRKEYARTDRERLATLRFVDLLTRRGDPRRALEIIEKMEVDERDSLWSPVAWRKARLLEEVGDSTGAQKILQGLALKRTVEGQRAALLLGKRALNAGDVEDARVWFNRVLEGPNESMKQESRRWLAGLGRLEKVVADSTLPRDTVWVRKAQIWAFDFQDPRRAWTFLDSLRAFTSPGVWPLSVLYLGVLVAPDSVRDSLETMLRMRDSTGVYVSRLGH